MVRYAKPTLSAISLKHLAIIIVLALAVVNFAVIQENKNLNSIFQTYPKAVILIFLTIAGLIFCLLLISALFKNNRYGLNYACAVLSPIIVLPLWETSNRHFALIIPILIVLFTQAFIFAILAKPDYFLKINNRQQKLFLSIFAVSYFCFFTYIGIRQFNSFSFFNPKDFGVFNQTFWNTVHGRFFLNSTYGSHFASHNSPFFLLLLPFYYALPHPLTLLILKNIFLTLSIIPFYLIAKDILKNVAAVVITVIFFFYPFIVTQNFAPPFEICFAPFFLLFAYFFYTRRKFSPFIFFLILSLSIKEQVALIAMAFGLYALLNRRESKWVAVPILLGIAWGVFSLIVLSFAGKIYHPHPDANWYLSTLRLRFFGDGTHILKSFLAGLASSNLKNIYILKEAIKFFLLPLGLIPALLSPIVILGLPELILNLIYDRPAMLSPIYHYNILVSSFLVIGAATGIRRISDLKYMKKIGIDNQVSRIWIAVFMFCCTLIFSQRWFNRASYNKNLTYVKTIKEALSYIPKDASISVPFHLAVQVSSREKYSLTMEGKPDYILIDKDTSLNYTDMGYKKIFDKDGVVVFKK